MSDILREELNKILQSERHGEQCDYTDDCTCWKSRVRDALAAPSATERPATPSEETAEELSRGTSVCDICGQDTPHHHDAETVEIERLVRPAFEKTTVPRNVFGRVPRKPDIPYSDAETERLWKHFIAGWFASRAERPCSAGGDGAAPSGEHDFPLRRCPHCGKTVATNELRAPVDRSQPPAPRVLFVAAVSGLLYENPEAAGDISAIRIDGKTYELAERAAAQGAQPRCTKCRAVLAGEGPDEVCEECADATPLALDELLDEPLGDSSFSEHVAAKLANLLTDKYTNSQKIAAGIIKQELRERLAALGAATRPQDSEAGR